MALTTAQQADYFKTQTGSATPLSPAQYEASLAAKAPAPAAPTPVSPAPTTSTQATSSSTQLRSTLAGQGVDVSGAPLMNFDQFKAAITPTTPPPTAPNATTQYTALRASTGIQSLEDQYTGYDSQIAALQDKLQANTNQSVGGETQGFVTGQAQTENAKIQMQIDSFTRQQGVLNDQIKFKNDFISTTMSNSQTDYSNSLGQWNTAFNQAMSIQNAFDTYQQKAVTEEQRVMTNARATLSAMTTLMSNNGQDIQDILKENPAYGNQIQALEMQAGYPPGFIQTFAAVKPRANVVASSETVDNGQKYLDVVSVNPGGGYSTTRVLEGPVSKLTSSASGKTIATLSDGTAVTSGDVDSVRQQILAVNGQDRLTNYEATYNYFVTDGGMLPTTFFSQFPVKNLLAPDTPDDASIVDTVARYPEQIVEQYSAGMKAAVAAAQQKNSTVIDNPQYQ